MPPDSSAREGELKKLVSGLSLAAGCRERSGQRAVCHSPRVNAVLCFCPRQARPPRAPGARGIKKRKLVAGLIPCLLAVCLGTARASPPEVVSFKGICDASAAIALDATRIIVGDDEKPWLSIYGLDGGDRQSKIALPHHAGGGEADIEGATVFGDRIVWISSNGRDKHGNAETERFQLFASHRLGDDHQWTEAFSPSFSGLPEAIAATTGETYNPLRKAIGDLNQTDADLAPKKHGFNIEGLTVSEDGEALLIGLRNPHPHGQAILFRVENAAALLDGTASTPKLGALVTLDLGDRGIRDITWSPAHHAYLIAAGQTDDDDPGPGFALFSWDGTGRPREITSFRSVLQDNRDFHPEAVTPLLEMSGGQLVASGRVLIVSDDGSKKLTDGTACKDADKSLKSFRAVVITVE